MCRRDSTPVTIFVPKLLISLSMRPVLANCHLQLRVHTSPTTFRRTENMSCAVWQVQPHPAWLHTWGADDSLFPVSISEANDVLEH